MTDAEALAILSWPGPEETRPTQVQLLRARVDVAQLLQSDCHTRRRRV